MGYYTMPKIETQNCWARFLIQLQLKGYAKIPGARFTISLLQKEFLGRLLQNEGRCRMRKEVDVKKDRRKIIR